MPSSSQTSAMRANRNASVRARAESGCVPPLIGWTARAGAGRWPDRRNRVEPAWPALCTERDGPGPSGLRSHAERSRPAPLGILRMAEDLANRDHTCWGTTVVGRNRCVGARRSDRRPTAADRNPARLRAPAESLSSLRD
ncbi:unnamed protein product [Rhizophagus irregularis]|uniref:Uncharacterized protein n=1 Tax=Rhizophagus irregularis TaxID=588596 RepID=A0A915ZW22_9GLOM|nr:unnamed protein product [Rhizophagus irregularis]